MNRRKFLLAFGGIVAAPAFVSLDILSIDPDEVIEARVLGEVRQAEVEIWLVDERGAAYQIQTVSNTVPSVVWTAVPPGKTFDRFGASIFVLSAKRSLLCESKLAYPLYSNGGNITLMFAGEGIVRLA
jgi:hypothetical protein